MPLQRTLAKAFGPDAATHPPAGNRSTVAGLRPADAASWLARARSVATSAAALSPSR